MPIDMFKEELINLTDVTRILPRCNGKRIPVCTAWRWCRKGISAVHLEYVRVGRRIFTSREALNRFFNALAIADMTRCEQAQANMDALANYFHEKLQGVRTPRQRQRDIEAAERRLAAMGV